MDTRTSDENLGSEEKVLLGFLGGAGLLVWVIVALFAWGRTAAPVTASVLNPLLAHPYVEPTQPLALAGVSVGGSLVDDDPPTRLAIMQPASPTATALPITPTLVPTLTPTPTPMPYGVPSLPIDGDVQVVALLGTDEPNDTELYRTDSLILAFIDRRLGRLALLSIPRDLWVRIPGYASNRINTVDSLGERTGYPGGGPALLGQTLRLNLGLPIHHYVRVDFAGFVRIIDALGGIDVDVTKPLPDIGLSAGSAHLDGRTALSYCRSRRNTSDFDRSRRQQQALLAAWKKALSLEALRHAPQLWDGFRDAIETDLTLADALQLAYFATTLEAGQVRSAQLDYRLARPWTTSLGAQVLLADTPAVQQVVLDLLAPDQ